MSRIVLALVLIMSHLITFGQKVQKVNEQLRTLTFFDLKNDSNRSFHKYNEEIPRILINALEQGKIKAYEVSDSSQVNELSFEEFKEKMELPGFEEDPFDWWDESDDYYLESEISIIGLDETIGFKKKKYYRRINYINLYVPEYVSHTGLRTYLASFRFEEFAKICSEEGYLWYQPELFYFWNANGFTNLYYRYFFESKAGNELIALLKSGKIKGFHKEGNSIDLDINFSNKYSDYPRFEIAFREPKGMPFKNTVIDIYYNPDGYYGSYNIQYLVSCNTSDFEEYQSSKVLYLSDAILTNLLTPLVNQYSNQLERDTISVNGTLKNGLSDPEYDPKGILAQVPSGIQIKKITNNQVSRIDLYDSINNVLVPEGQEISRYLMEAIDTDKLEIYWTNALEKQMTKEEYTEAITMIEPAIDPFADPFEYNEDEVYLYSPLSLTIFLLSQKAEFDLKSGEKLLNPYAIGMTLRADDSPYGLDQTVGWLNVNDVKNLLIDKKAEATFFGEKLNYYDILMSDKIISYFQVGSHIKVLKN